MNQRYANQSNNMSICTSYGWIPNHELGSTQLDGCPWQKRTSDDHLSMIELSSVAIVGSMVAICCNGSIMVRLVVFCLLPNSSLGVITPNGSCTARYIDTCTCHARASLQILLQICTNIHLYIWYRYHIYIDIDIDGYIHLDIDIKHISKTC